MSLKVSLLFIILAPHLGCGASKPVADVSESPPRIEETATQSTPQSETVIPQIESSPPQLETGEFAMSQEQPMPPEEPIGIVGYLRNLSLTLDLFYTLEDRAGNGSFPRAYDVEIVPDYEITSIDDLVEYLNNQQEVYQAVRSTKIPLVIHLIAKDLNFEDYLLTESMTLNFAGGIGNLPGMIGEQFENRIRSQTSFLIGGPTGDYSEIDVNYENETIRDIFTMSVPFLDYGPWIWQCVYGIGDVFEGWPEYTVLFLGSWSKFDEEELLMLEEEKLETSN